MTADMRNREYELKFKGRPNALRKFIRAVDAARGENSAWSVAHLSNRYFDTKDRSLEKKGVSLRIRRSNGAAVQTVKAAGNKATTAMDRREWEQPLTGNELLLAALADDARRAIGNLPAGELRPMMEVEFVRQSATIRRVNPIGPDLIVEAAADKGEVRTDGRSERFTECELELVEGDIDSFFRLAGEINEACALSLSTTTKSARGYRLLDDGGSCSRKAPKFDIAADRTAHEALADILATCVRNIIDNEDACLDGSDPEGVHQMRVSLRRLRSSLAVFGRLIEPERIDWMKDDLKWLANSLGPARDWDVYIGETLAAVTRHGVDDRTLGALRRAANRQRKAAYRQVRETLHGERFARMTFRLTAFAATEGWLPTPHAPHDRLLVPLERTAAKILRRPYRKLMKEAAGLASKDAEARHKVRIRLKKLRYTVDFLQGVFPGSETKKFVKALRDLQDRFGHLNDVAQAVRLTDALADDGAAGKALIGAADRVREWHASALLDSEPGLIAAWEKFATATPFWESGT